MATVKTQIVLEGKEAIFLSAVLGENTLVGVEDPFLGWLAEQVEAEWLRCRDEMIVKGYLTVDGVKGMQVRKDLETALRISCDPDVRILMEQSVIAGSVSCHIMNAKRNSMTSAVMHTTGAEVQISITEHATADELIVTIMGELALVDHGDSDSFSIEIPEELLTRAMGMPENDRSSFLTASLHTIDRKTAGDCAKSICNPKRKMFVSANTIDSEKYMPDSFGLFEGENSLVYLRVSDERCDRLIAEIISSTTLQNKLAGYLL